MFKKIIFENHGTENLAKGKQVKIIEILLIFYLVNIILYVL